MTRAALLRAWLRSLGSWICACSGLAEPDRSQARHLMQLQEGAVTHAALLAIGSGRGLWRRPCHAVALKNTAC